MYLFEIIYMYDCYNMTIIQKQFLKNIEMLLSCMCDDFFFLLGKKFEAKINILTILKETNKQKNPLNEKLISNFK